MKNYPVPLFILIGLAAFLLVTACRGTETLPAGTPFPTPTSKPSSKSNQEILADAFFFGCAYLDSNENKYIDENDEPIKNAVFLVKLPAGGLTVRTGSDGCATLVVPGGVKRSAWPVETRMDPPPETDLKMISPTPVTLEYPNSHADFLFEVKDNGE
jgi:hypothetical protein